MKHLFQFHSELAFALCDDPARCLPLFEKAARETLNVAANQTEIHHMQVQLIGLDRSTTMRNLDSTNVNRLVSLSGIVIAASTVRSKVQQLKIRCRNCKETQTLESSKGFGGVNIPRRCPTQPSQANSTKCPLDPFVVLADSSTYYDQQSLKLQERPEHVPNGDMPRHLSLSVERYLVSKVKPGTRVKLVGIYATYTSKNSKDAASRGNDGVRHPYIRVLGLNVENETEVQYSREDEEDMYKLARSRTSEGGSIYELVAQSIAPAIYGHEDIKKAIACQLVGGCRRALPDGMRLRGDINVLLLGDPSVAKSQFLKFVNRAAPISVYTSGKGSSAAGLTASVLRDPGTGDFHLEGGALVLGDGGVVCIDEFDKMREQDRVAIHEAMEQQTISIAKAGITTVLNARSSVLAAANPIHGRYDELMTAGENISLQTTILSRFDTIFILLDKSDRTRDAQLSKHVLDIHRNFGTAAMQEAEGPISPELLRKYVTFCKQRCRPYLSPEAAEHLKSHYVGIRSKVKKDRSDSPIPITVRQLEAIIRLSEALARLELSEVANIDHVTEAIRLFKSSTMHAVESGVMVEGLGSMESRENIVDAEQFIKARVGINMRVSREALRRQYMTTQQHSNPQASFVDMKPIDMALQILHSRGDVKFVNQARFVHRVR